MSLDVDEVINEYVASQKRLLEIELRSEQEEHQQHHGQTNSSSNADQDADTSKSRILSNLQVDHLAVGLMGRTVVHMTPISNHDSERDATSQSGGNSNENYMKKSQSSEFMLPAHRLKVGDEVEMFTKSSLSWARNKNPSHDGGGKKRERKGGVITEVTETSISIALFEKNHSGNAGRTSDKQTMEGTSSAKNKGSRGKSDGQGSQIDEDDSDLFDKGPLTLVPRSSVDVHNKLIQGLEELNRGGVDHDPAGKVIRAIFSPDKDMVTNQSDATGIMDLSPFNTQLDDSQMNAIKFALFGNKPISLIHGPPGTGKTNSVAELILQAVHNHKLRVLVTAPSNVAVDNVLERIVSITKRNNSDSNASTGKNERRKRGDKGGLLSSLRMVRLGHPARIQPSILRYSLETLVQNADGTDIVSEIRDEMKSYLDIASKPKTRKMERRVAYREIKTLRKEIRQREEKVVEDLMKNAQVVFATNVGASNRILRNLKGREQSFDLVIIDEAAQALEASCWIPILKGKRIVLAGDHKQLAPTIKSRDPQVQKMLGRTLFERLMTKHEQISRMLQIQYRMHESIANWASHAMYGGRLMSHDSVKSRKLCHLPYVSIQGGESGNEGEGDETSILSTTQNASLLLIDTAGCDMFESSNAAGSRYNEGEADIVAKHVRNLISIGMKPEDIAVITPYNGQVEILRQMLLKDYQKLEIRSVDGFQGGEREVVVLSLVRSSDRGGRDGIGFLSDKRRLNVAVTRAKRQCTVICDSETVSQNNFLKGLVDWMEEHGEYLSAMEYAEDTIETVHTADVEKDAISASKTTSCVENDQKNQVPQKDGAPTLESEQGSQSKSEKIQSDVSYTPSEEEIIAQKEDIEERLTFFAEIAEDGEELEIDIIALPAVQNHLECSCAQLSLQFRCLQKETDKSFYVITPMGDDHIEETASTGTGLMNKSNDAFANEAQASNTILERKGKETEIVQLDENKDTSVTDNPSIRYPPKTSELAADEGSNRVQKSEPQNMNSFLATLAKERESRSRASQPNGKDEGSTRKSSTGKKKTKKKGQKLKSKKEKKDDDFHGMDDLAFLDAQIEKVQTSHGRKIDAKGSNYRTIVNGMLIAKPKPKEKLRNSRAAGALSSKIKQAQENRKAKPKKK